MRGHMDRYQKPEPKLALALARSLADPSPYVLNAIVPAPAVGPGNHRWILFWEANAGIIGMLPKRTYGSASLSRMDSCPQLHTAEYWLTVSRLWKDSDITLVHGSERSLTAEKLMESPNAPKSIHTMRSAFKNSWSMYDELLKDIEKAGNEKVVLCTGLVTRPLVHALCETGHRAYDLGHLGQWFNKGLPIEVLHP